VIVADNKPYTTQLQAGLGPVNETKTLLELWSPGMSANQLHQVALESGRFPTVTARRLRNIVVECFALAIWSMAVHRLLTSSACRQQFPLLI